MISDWRRCINTTTTSINCRFCIFSGGFCSVFRWQRSIFLPEVCWNHNLRVGTILEYILLRYVIRLIIRDDWRSVKNDHIYPAKTFCILFLYLLKLKGMLGYLFEFQSCKMIPPGTVATLRTTEIVVAFVAQVIFTHISCYFFIHLLFWINTPIIFNNC